MSLSVCAITGQPLRHPVASRITGHLFQQQIITKHLGAFPYCPITNKPMSLQDLIVIKQQQNLYNRPEQSPMTYLGKLEQEYNLLVIDTFSLRKSLKETEQELGSALYQNEAASRVIGRLVKQKDDIESQITKLQARIAELKTQKKSD